MTKISIQGGSPWTITAPAALTVDVPILLGAKLVVPAATFASGAQATVYRSGLFGPVAKATGEAWIAGTKLYWDDSAKKFTTTATSNTVQAYADRIAASGDTTGYVQLIDAVS